MKHRASTGIVKGELSGFIGKMVLKHLQHKHDFKTHLSGDTLIFRSRPNIVMFSFFGFAALFNNV